jgi:hypothetical protein
MDFNVMRIPEGEWSGSAKTLEGARKMYQTRIMRPATVECDLQMRITFGGHYYTIDTPFRPQFSTAYIYLARWRKDGAFMESYHINDSKFAERPEERNELDKNTRNPGLLSHWSALEQAKKKAKTLD